jgi:DivIVA domain-containing protein
VTTTFPTAKRKTPAYKPEQVDAFLAQARVAYDTYDQGAPTMTSGDVRRVAFDIAKKGYAAPVVDAALERLEVAFAELERERAIETEGWEGLSNRSRESLVALTSRFARPEKKRFARVNAFATGYRIADVDAFVDEVRTGIESGAVLRASWVRQAVFRPQKRGYSEVQVDLVLDELIEALIAAGQA